MGCAQVVGQVAHGDLGSCECASRYRRTATITLAFRPSSSQRLIAGAAQELVACAGAASETMS